MYKNNNSIITKDDTGSYLTLKFNQENRYRFKYTNTSYSPRNVIRNSDCSVYYRNTYQGGNATGVKTMDDGTKCIELHINQGLWWYKGYLYGGEPKAPFTYTVSADIYIKSYTNDYSFFQCGFERLGSTGFPSYRLSSFPQGEWTRHVFTSSTINTDNTGSPLFKTWGSGECVVYIKNVMIEIGTSSGVWAAAPEENGFFDSIVSGSAESRIAAATEANASINSKTLFSNKYIYGWTLHNQYTFDFQNIMNNFRLVGEYENGVDAVNKNYLYSDTESTAPRPFEHEYTSHSEVINFDNIKTKLTNAPINCSAKPNDLLFLCVTEYGEDQTYKSQIKYDVVSGSVTMSSSEYENDVPIPCEMAPKYTVIPIFDKNIFVDIAVNSAVECVNKRKHERDSILYDMLKIKAIECSLRSGDFGTAIDFWKVFILAQDIEYDECFKEETRYERDKCDCSYIVNYD